MQITERLISNKTKGKVLKCSKGNGMGQCNQF